MAYNSVEFLLFFAIFVAVYLIMPIWQMRLMVILAGNLVFYYIAAGRSLLIIVLMSSSVVYAASLLIGHIYKKYERKSANLEKEDRRALLASCKKKALAAAVFAFAFLLAILVWGKVGKLLDFKVVKGFSLLGARTVMIPLGISYYTFSSIGYILDLYYRKAKVEKNYLVFLSSMTFFPAITEGPISRYDRLMKQMRALPSFSYERVTFGLQRMVWGFFKKMVVADRLAVFHTEIFGNLSEYAGVEIIAAIAANALHLYADFSGCMDIVIGAAEVMGISLDENFRQPFFAKGAAEFWRRWHITLGTWFRDYVYMPIAMRPSRIKKGAAIRKSRGKKAADFYQSAFPLILVWLLTGLWHGSGADYVIWGFYWGILILIETTFADNFAAVNRFLKVKEDGPGRKIFLGVRTFLYFSAGRMITALGRPDSFVILIRKIAEESRIYTLFDGSMYLHGLDLPDMFVCIFGLILMWAVSIWQTRYNVREKISGCNLPLRWFIYIGGIVAIVVLGMYGPLYNATSFIYGAF